MKMNVMKKIALFAFAAVLFIGSMHIVVSDLEARGGGRGGGGRGGGRGGRGGGHRGGHGRHGQRSGRQHRGYHHGNHGHHGWNHGGYGYGGYGYGGGYWNSAGIWVPAVVGGVALGAAAASSGGTTVVEDGGNYDNAYPSCGVNQYFDESTGECVFAPNAQVEQY